MTNRKFKLTVVILIANFDLLCFQLITGEQWMTLCMGILTMYIVGNVTQKFKG